MCFDRSFIWCAKPESSGELAVLVASLSVGPVLRGFSHGEPSPDGVRFGVSTRSLAEPLISLGCFIQCEPSLEGLSIGVNPTFRGKSSLGVKPWSTREIPETSVLLVPFDAPNSSLARATSLVRPSIEFWTTLSSCAASEPPSGAEVN